MNTNETKMNTFQQIMLNIIALYVYNLTTQLESTKCVELGALLPCSSLLTLTFKTMS